MIKNIAAEKTRRTCSQIKEGNQQSNIVLEIRWYVRGPKSSRTGFSNKLFMEEVSIYCPVWFLCTLGTCGLSQEVLQM